MKFYKDAIMDHLYSIQHDILLTMLKWGPGQPYVHPTNLFHHLGHTCTIKSKNIHVFIAEYSEGRSDKCRENLTQA